MKLASLSGCPALAFCAVAHLPQVKSVPRMSLWKRVTMCGKVVVNSQTLSKSGWYRSMRAIEVINSYGSDAVNNLGLPTVKLLDGCKLFLLPYSFGDNLATAFVDPICPRVFF